MGGDGSGRSQVRINIKAVVKALGEESTADELVEKTGLNARSLYRYLHILDRDGYEIARTFPEGVFFLRPEDDDD